MKKVVAFLLLITPIFASAKVESEAKTVYQTIAGELLIDCTGVDKKVAVAGFSYSDGRDSRDSGVVAERITTELVKAKEIKVIERKEIEKVFGELQLQRSGAIDPDSAKEIGKMLGADWVVVGTLTELHDMQLELNARLVGVESGEIINAANTTIKKDWLDQYEKLLEEQNKAIEKNGKDAKSFYERGRTNADLKDYERAIANFGIAITINPVYWEAYLARAVAYVNGISDWDKALDDVNKAIEIDPQKKSSSGASSYRIRGILYFQKGEYDKTISDSAKAIEINPKDAYAYYWRGRAHYAQERAIGSSEIEKYIYDKAKAILVKAIKAYSKAIELKPELWDTYYWRGLAFYMNGEHDKAIADLTQAIKVGPESESYDSYFWRGFAYYQEGRRTVGVRDVAKSIAANPNCKNCDWSWAKRDKEVEDLSETEAQGRVRAGNDKAIEDFTSAIAINNTAEAYKMRGLAYRDNGENNKAVNDLIVAVKLNPEYQPILRVDIEGIERILNKSVTTTIDGK